MAITSNTMGSAAGDVNFEFTDSTNRDNIGSGQTMDLVDVGDIAYVFDQLDPNEEVYTNVGQYQDTIQVKIWDTLSDGSSLESKLRTYSDNNSSPLATGATAPCKLTIGGYDWFVVFKPYQYSTDDIQNITTVDVELEVFPPDLRNAPATPSPAIDDSDGSALSPQAYPTGYLFALNLGDRGYESWIAQSSEGFQHIDVPTGSGTYTWCAQDVSGYDITSYIAAFGGGYYGGGFGEGFYVDRLYTGDTVNLTDQDIIDIGRSIQLPNVQDINTTFVNEDDYTGGDITDQSVSETIDSTADKDLDIDIPDTSVITLGVNVYRAEWNASLSRQLLLPDGGADSDAAAQLQNVIDSYKRSVAASSKLYIDITIEGFDTVKPWQSFDITDATGELTSYESKTFRFAEVTYNIDNTITGKAYEIA